MTVFSSPMLAWRVQSFEFLPTVEVIYQMPEWFVKHANKKNADTPCWAARPEFDNKYCANGT
jgi:hypothetical protein